MLLKRIAENKRKCFEIINEKKNAALEEALQKYNGRITLSTFSKISNERFDTVLCSEVYALKHIDDSYFGVTLNAATGKEL